MAYRVGMVSLGCAKNQVNSEQMLWLLKAAGYEIATEIANLDAVIINTCGFIERAKSEAIENILEFASLKEEGRLKKIIVTGCLPQRYGEEMRQELPEVDGLVGCGSFDEIVKALDRVMEGEKACLFGDVNGAVSEVDRIISTGPGWAYIKIAEGCDNRCSYCVIPSLRGSYRSRPMENIIREAKKLAASGLKELIIVAQDITRYGFDFSGKRLLAELIKKLSEIEGIEWIRLHYLYPDEIDDELIREIAENKKVVKYLDIPIQHINDKILKSMNRRGTGDEIRRLLKRLREEIPGLVLRTSIITGLPGEGEAEFEELCEFLLDAKIERAGVFPYSPEEGTAAERMPGRPSREEAERRAELIMDIQCRIMDQYNESLFGKTIKVLCEGYDRFAECYYGRSEADSPEVDGKVFFTGKNIRPGEFSNVKITGTLDGDLLGEAL
ncbi:MAG: 30S ribosomal protein S12 methylthiotransferase RimO [Clostridiales bacterium]|jgi:ribosomal protein S12 methylthiotransferase|nr:30S ribosomal protein S12 methylthiotransferase RimO [Clostridiales bacterium]